MTHTHDDGTSHAHGEDGRHFHPDPASPDLVRWELPPGTDEAKAPEYEAAIRARRSG